MCERRRAVPGRAVPRAHDRRVGRWRGHVRNGKKLGGKYPKIDMVWQGNAVTFRLVPERRVAVAGKIIGRASMVFPKVGRSPTVPLGRRMGRLHIKPS